MNILWSGAKEPISPPMSSKIILRSVRYDPNCRCPSKAGIPPWAIAIVILVVLMVAVVIFVIYRYTCLSRF